MSKIKKSPTVPTQLISRLDDLRRDLRSRGYKDKIIQDQFLKCLLIGREDALKKVQKSQKNNTRIIP